MAAMIEEITSIFHFENLSAEGRPFKYLLCSLSLKDDGWYYLCKSDMKCFHTQDEEDAEIFTNRKLKESDDAAKVLRSYLKPVAEIFNLSMEKLGPLPDLSVKRMIEYAGSTHEDNICKGVGLYYHSNGYFLLLENIIKHHHESF